MRSTGRRIRIIAVLAGLFLVTGLTACGKNGSGRELPYSAENGESTGEAIDLAEDRDAADGGSAEGDGSIADDGSAEGGEAAEDLTEEERAEHFLEDTREAYLLHWQEKLLAEGKIADKNEIGEIYTDTSQYNLAAEIAEGKKLRLYLITVTPEYQFGFYQSVLTLDSDFRILDSEDLEFCGIKTYEDAVTWSNISYFYSWFPVQEAMRDPISSAKVYLSLGEGRGEFIRTDLKFGYLIYTFADGTKMYYGMAYDKEIWYPFALITNDAYMDAYMAKCIEIRDTLENVTAKELRDVTVKVDPNTGFDGQEGFMLLQEFPEQDAAIYSLSDGHVGGDAMALRVGEQAFPIYLAWDIFYTYPDFYAADYDGDGVTEYAIHILNGRGSGFRTYALYMLDVEDGELQIREFERSSSWYPSLNTRVVCSERDEGWVLTIDGEDHFEILQDFSDFLQENHLTSTGFVWGDIMDFVERDGQWYLDVKAGFMIPESAVPQYEYSFCLTSPVIYGADGTFSLGEILAERENDF